MIGWRESPTPSTTPWCSGSRPGTNCAASAPRQTTSLLTSATVTTSRERVSQAIQFLAWLTDRGDALATCQQAGIDAWFAENYNTRKPTEAFLHWAIGARVMPRLVLLRRPLGPAIILTQSQRLDQIRTLLESETVPLRERIAGLILLLYAQPLSHIVRLTYTDVLVTGNETFLRLGEPPAPVPQRVASLLREFLEQRSVYRGPNADTAWLFSGLRADQPLHHRTLANTLDSVGVPAQIMRTTALRQLVQDVPAPVVATMLTYHQNTTARLASEVGGTWSRYARPDPTRRSMDRAGIHGS